MQHFNDDPLKECPECGGSVHRVICPVGIVFRGSGFYKTDHPTSSSSSERPHKVESSKETGEKKAAPAAEGEKAKPAEAKPTESKPATKETAV